MSCSLPKLSSGTSARPQDQQDIGAAGSITRDFDLCFPSAMFMIMVPVTCAFASRCLRVDFFLFLVLFELVGMIDFML